MSTIWAPLQQSVFMDSLWDYRWLSWFEPEFPLNISLRNNITLTPIFATLTPIFGARLGAHDPRHQASSSTTPDKEGKKTKNILTAEAQRTQRKDIIICRETTTNNIISVKEKRKTSFYIGVLGIGLACWHMIVPGRIS